MRIPKIFFRIILFLVLVVFLAATFIHFAADSIAKNLLQKQFEKATKGQYSLSIQDVHVSLFNGDLLIKGPKIISTPQREEDAPYIFFTADGLEIQDFSWFRYLLDKRLEVEEFSITNGVLDLKIYNNKSEAAKEQDFNLEQLDIYPLIQDRIKEAEIEKITLQNFEISIAVLKPSDSLYFKGSQLNVQLNDIFLDKNQLITPHRTFYSESIALNGSALDLKKTGAAPFSAEANTFEINSRQGKASLSLRSANFSNGHGSLEDSLFSVELQLLDVREFDLAAFKEDSAASIAGIVIKDVSFIKKNGAETLSSADKSQINFKIEDFSLSSFLPPLLQKVQIINLSLKDISGSVEDYFTVKDADLEIDNLLIDEGAAFSNGRFMHAQSLMGFVGYFRLEGEDEKLEASFSGFKIQGNGKYSSTSLDSLAIKIEAANKYGNWIDLEIAHMTIDSISTAGISNGKLRLKSLLIHDPQLNVYFNPSGVEKENTSGSSSEPFEINQLNLYPKIQEQLEQIVIGRLSIHDLALRLNSKNPANSLKVFAPSLSIYAGDVLLGKEGAFSPKRSFYAREWELFGKEIKIEQAGEKKWKTLANGLKLSINEKFAKISLMGLDFIMADKALQDTLLALSFIDLQFVGLDLYQLQKEKLLELEKVASRGLIIIPKETVVEVKEADTAGTTNFDGQKSFFADFNPAEDLPGFIRKIAVKELELENIKIPRKNTPLNFSQARLSAKNILVEDKSAFAENRFLYAKELASDIYRPQISLSEPKQEIKSEALHFKIKDGKGELVIQDINSFADEEDSIKLWFNGEIEAISLNGINTQSLSSGTFVVDCVAVKKPELVIHFPSSPQTQASSSEKGNLPDLYPALEKALDTLTVNKFFINEGNVRLSGLGDSYYGLHIPFVRVKAEDIVIAPRTAFLDDRILHASDWKATLKDIHYLFPDKVYLLQLGQLNLSSHQKEIEAKEFWYGYTENYRKKLEGEETNEVYRIENKHLKAENVDWQTLFKEGAFYADKLEANGLDIYVYKDFNVPWIKKFKPMPPTIVRELGLPLSIKDIQLKNMEVVYEEMKKGADTAGLVDITEMKARISNFTNIEKELRQNPEMEIAALGRLMGKGYFQTHITVPLYDRSRKLRITGTLDTLDATELNRIVRYNSRIAIRSGSFYKLNWDFEADNELASGIMEVSYEHLKVQLSQPSSPDTTGVFKDVGSFLINALVVDSNIAEEKGKEPKPVHFEEERNQERSFFHFYVQSLLAGLIEAIGIPFQ